MTEPRWLTLARAGGSRRVTFLSLWHFSRVAADDDAHDDLLD